MIRVALVDDQTILVSSLAVFLDAQPDIEVVATGFSGDDAVALTHRHLVDVLLLDLQMPGMGGMAALTVIKSRPSAPAVLVLTTFDTEELVAQAVHAGADGFLLKGAELPQLLTAVRNVAAGNSYLDPQVTRGVVEALRSRRAGLPEAVDLAVLARLTPREREVLALVGEGLTNAELAARLHVAETTVKTHVSSLLTKLECRDRIALVRCALTAEL